MRVILADLQLADNAEIYRSIAWDANVREALRRWDAYVRVVNIGEFERRVMAGQWQIVYAGTESPIQGADAVLYANPKAGSLGTKQP